MYRNKRPELSTSARTAPAHWYTDAAFFEKELETVFFDLWLCAGRSGEIPEPGDYFTREVGSDNVVVLRDGEGGLRAFHNVCRHRGTRLCSEPSGHTGKSIQCPYHAWTYALDGRLLNAPHMDRVQGFKREDYPLHAVAVDGWDGHVFLNFSEAPGPLSDHLLDLPDQFRAWGMAELERVHRQVYEVSCNWKLIIQNYSECLHCPVIHPLLNRQSHHMSGENAPPQPTYLGGRMELREGVRTLSLDGQSAWSALPGLSQKQKRQVVYYAVLPNLLLNLHPDYMVTYTLWPRSHDGTEIVCEWHFHPQEIEKPGFDPSPAVEFWDLTNRQDWQVSESAQLGIGSSAYRPGPYSNREELLLALDRIIEERTGGY